MTEEVKATIIAYFTVPSDKTSEQYIEELEVMNNDDLFKKVDDFQIFTIEVNN